MITICIAQKTKKAMNVWPGTFAQSPQAVDVRESRARPPIQVCMPN
jgi:hypothetical protein